METQSDGSHAVGRSELSVGLGLSFQQYAGKWQIGGNFGLCISVKEKPGWITRWLCLKLLEWEWIDTPNVKVRGAL